MVRSLFLALKLYFLSAPRDQEFGLTDRNVKFVFKSLISYRVHEPTEIFVAGK